MARGPRLTTAARLRTVRLTTARSAAGAGALPLSRSLPPAPVPRGAGGPPAAVTTAVPPQPAVPGTDTGPSPRRGGRRSRRPNDGPAILPGTGPAPRPDAGSDAAGLSGGAGPDAAGLGAGLGAEPETAGPDAGPDTAGLLRAAVDWALYRDGIRQPVPDFDTACRAARAGEGFVWLGLHEPTTQQLALLGEVFGLHPLALEDASNPRQRPKLQRYDEAVFLAVRTLAYLDHGDRAEGGDIVETGVIIVFVGEDFVVTVRHGRHASMTGLRRRLEADRTQLALGPSAVLHAVADKVVDDYLAVTDAVNEDIEEIENEVFGSGRTCDIERIYQLKRDVIEMKRTTGPLAMPLHELAERPRRLVNPEIREYFRDVADHLARVREQVQSFDELLSSILQAGLARITVSENEDMRKISAWVAIAAMPTMIAGIYGMNFQHMPELSAVWGYPAVLAGMAVVCALMWRGFRRNGWL